jgi:neutral ceramidase
MLRRLLTTVLILLACDQLARAGDPPLPPTTEVGLAVRDITPELPIPLAGYEARKHPANKIDHPLVAQALAFKNNSGDPFVFVAIDNCEVSHAFVQPIYQALAAQCKLPRGAVSVISSHTHSAPVLAETLPGMPTPAGEEQQNVEKYSRTLQAKIIEAATAALADLKPSLLEYGQGRAGFAMNRRIFRDGKVDFGDNPEGPVDWDVPVLRIKGTNGAVRAIVFGYACHGTTVRTGDDWYVVSGEYMAYAREQLEALHPGAVALYLTGMGADSDPYPRGPLLDARRHGLELAGAIMGVLDRPMRPIRGEFKLAYDEVDLPLIPPPAREQIEKDVQSTEPGIKQRATLYLKLLNESKPLPQALTLPIAALRFADDLTFILVGGEVVVDYSRRLKRVLAEDHPWTIGYAYEVPSYIPSARVLKEGGYEAEFSLIYYGLYGPFRPDVEDLLVNRISSLVAGLRPDHSVRPLIDANKH